MRFLFWVITLIGVVLSPTSYSQCVPPQWQNEGISSYCHAIEVMESPLGGYWVAFWGSPKEMIKDVLLMDSVDFVETDSSLIFYQDIISRHELIFDRDYRLNAVKSHHKFLEYTSYGYDITKRWMDRYEVIFDKKEEDLSYQGYGTEYRWDSNDNSCIVNVKMTTEIKEIYYIVNVFMSKEL
jgi:hypothetical protein